MIMVFFFFFNDTATTEIYTTRHTLSLHDALPISAGCRAPRSDRPRDGCSRARTRSGRSEEHTSELQVTPCYLVCRLLLEKKKKTTSQDSRPAHRSKVQQQKRQKVY